MSTLARTVSLTIVLCLFLSAAPGFARPGANKGTMNAAQNHSSRAVCALTGDCPDNRNRPRGTICRDNGPCIPASPAWSSDGPLATNAQKPGGFPALNPADPLAVPLPAPGLLLLSALFGLGIISQRTRRQKIK